jgi:hypothetical protein
VALHGRERITLTADGGAFVDPGASARDEVTGQDLSGGVLAVGLGHINAAPRKAGASGGVEASSGPRAGCGCVRMAGAMAEAGGGKSPLLGLYGEQAAKYNGKAVYRSPIG